MPGRLPRPGSVLQLEKGKLYGEQKERAENELEPEKSLEPSCPVSFRPTEKEAWNYLAEILKNYGVFAQVNGPLLEMAAIYLAEFRNCQIQITTKGRATRGGKNRNPAIRERNKCAEILIKVLSDLNISTSGLAKLGSLVVKSKKKKDEFFGE